MKSVMDTISQYATYLAQLLAVSIIVTGMLRAIYYYIKNRLVKTNDYAPVLQSRLELGHTLSLGLSFLIGASILKSAISPTWDDIGKLAAIIALRTIMNYFLSREIKELSRNLPDE